MNTAAPIPDPSLAARVNSSLHRLRTVSGVPLAIGALVQRNRALRLDLFSGNTAGVINGVSVDFGHGLGGKVLTLNRPLVVDDYLVSPHITHRYNPVIAAENVHTMVAAPVLVDRVPVAVIYAALRSVTPIGDRTLDAISGEARQLEQQIVAAHAAGLDDVGGDGLRERVAAAYAQLRELTRTVDDHGLASAITRITDELLGDTGPTGQVGELTAREQDVLALAALGFSNARIAQSLGIGLHTTKGYMKAVLHKLGASNRVEAVVIARRNRLLP